MSTNARGGKENTATDRTELDDRTRRALTECMSVLPESADVGIYVVVGQNENGSYTVDVEAGRCSCPDHKHRDARCKHLRRVAFATGERAVPATVEDVDPQLGTHVEGGPILAASDGGTAADAGTTNDGPAYTYHYEPAHVGGAKYVRCERCGAESVPADPDSVLHAKDCPESTREWGR